MTRNLAHPFLRRALVLALVLVGLCAPQTWGQITGQDWRLPELQERYGRISRRSLTGGSHGNRGA